MGEIARCGNSDKEKDTAPYIDWIRAREHRCLSGKAAYQKLELICKFDRRLDAFNATILVAVTLTRATNHDRRVALSSMTGLILPFLKSLYLKPQASTVRSQ